MNGFIAKNLLVRLAELGGFEVVKFSANTRKALPALVQGIDAVVHLAEHQPAAIPAEFVPATPAWQNNCAPHLPPQNVAFLSFFFICKPTATTLMAKQGDAEHALWVYAEQTQSAVYIYRLPNVFGKWCKPNYNSAVATFCHNMTRGLPITINDPSVALTLVYIDVVDNSCGYCVINPPLARGKSCQVPTEYTATVGEIANT